MDFKDRMIEAEERGWATPETSYEYVRESYADAADLERKRRKEEPEEDWPITEGPTGIAGFKSGRYV